MSVFFLVVLALAAAIEALHVLWRWLDVRATAPSLVSHTVAEARAAGTLVRTYRPTPTAVTLADGRRFEMGEGFVERCHRFRPRRYFRREMAPLDGYAFRFSYSPYPTDDGDVYTTFKPQNERNLIRHGRRGGSLFRTALRHPENSYTVYFVDERAGIHHEVVYR